MLPVRWARPFFFMPRPFRLTHPKPPTLSENDVERAVLDLLHTRGYLEFRLHTGKLKTPDGRWIEMNPEGTPDYVVMHPHHPAFLLEAKRPGATPSKAQIARHVYYTVGWRLTVAIIDSVDAMLSFIHTHEARTSLRDSTGK